MLYKSTVCPQCFKERTAGREEVQGEETETTCDQEKLPHEERLK